MIYPCLIPGYIDASLNVKGSSSYCNVLFNNIFFVAVCRMEMTLSLLYCNIFYLVIFTMGLVWAYIKSVTISICWANTINLPINLTNVVRLLAAILSMFFSLGDCDANFNSYNSLPNFLHLYLIVIIHKIIFMIPP